MSDPEVCAGINSGAPVPDEAPENEAKKFFGLYVKQGSKYRKDALEVPTGGATTLTKNQPIWLGSHLAPLKDDTLIEDLNFRINSLYISEVKADALNANRFEATLMLTGSSEQTKKAFAPRKVGSIFIETTGAGAFRRIAGCSMGKTAAAVCEGMGCEFDKDAAGGKCRCGIPNLECTSGYIAGYDVESGTPICKEINFDCSSRGEDYFLSGITPSGSPICTQWPKPAPSSCRLNDSIIDNGKSVRVFYAAKVPYGSTCQAETRTCYEGNLSGSFKEPECVVEPKKGTVAPPPRTIWVWFRTEWYINGDTMPNLRKCDAAVDIEGNACSTTDWCYFKAEPRPPIKWGVDALGKDIIWKNPMWTDYLSCQQRLVN